MPRRWFSLVWAGAVVALLLSVGVRWALVDGAPPVFSPDTGSYTRFAANWQATGQLPPVEQRPPGYPLFLIVTAGATGAYWLTVLAQQALGIASTLILYGLVLRLTAGHVWMALGAVVLNLTLVDLVLMEIVVYAETLTGACVNLAALALAVGLSGSRRPAPWLILSGLCWTLAAFARPVMLAALGPFAVAVVLWSRQDWRADRRERIRAAAAAVLLPVLIVGAYLSYNAARDGRPRFATGLGYSLLNYVAYPEMYNNLPPEMADVARLYMGEAPKVARAHVWWYHVMGPLADLRAADGRAPLAPDDLAYDTATAAIRARPGITASIWLRTLRRYLFTYDLRHGLLISNQLPPTPENIRLSPWAYDIARTLERLWQVLLPPLSLGALALPVVLWLTRRREARPLMALWFATIVVVLVNVSVEPFGRQARYRIPIQHVMIALAVTSAYGFRARRSTS